MPANKLQHYVPRCYLRPFCIDDHGAAINLFNIARDIAIRAVSVKGQCARSYFYGKDGELEKALQKPEGLYAQRLKKAVADPASLNANDLASLRAFMFLQVFRSAAWIDRQRSFLEAHRQLVQGEGTPELLASFDSSHADLVDLAFDMYNSTSSHIADLATCVLVNETKREFISSDDPAVHTNRFHVQKRIEGGHGFGSSGAMLFMPMSPKLMLVAFDPNVYRLTGRRGNTASITKTHDVDRFNQFQVLHADSNLYFRTWSEAEAVSAAFQRGKSYRRDHWFSIEILQETAPKSDTYIAVKAPFEPDLERREMLHTQQILPKPEEWPRILPYVLRPKVIDTGTAEGLRRPTALGTV